MKKEDVDMIAQMLAEGFDSMEKRFDRLESCVDRIKLLKQLAA